MKGIDKIGDLDPDKCKMANRLVDLETGEIIWCVLYDGFDEEILGLRKLYFECGKGDEGRRIIFEYED